MKSEKLIQGFFYNNPDNYPPIINGARLLAEAGFKVELYCRDDGKDWQVSYPDAVTIERIGPVHANTQRNYFSFCRHAMSRGKRSATAFIGHDLHGLVPARLLAGRFKRPLVYHCYDYSGNGYGRTFSTSILGMLQFGFARRAGLVTVPDEGLAQLLASDLRLKRLPLVMVNSPLNRSKREGALHTALRERERNFDKIVLRQGRIGPGHALEVTLRSIPRWTSRKWGFVVMGIGDAGYIQSLTELAVSLGVENQFVVLPPVAYDQVARFTGDADLGHALYEPAHVNNLNIAGACKIQEYLAAGLPLLVSDRPSLRSLIEEYSCGVTACDTSPQDIARAVNTLLDDEESARQMGLAAAHAFETKFRFDFQFQPVIDVLQGLSKKEPTAGPPILIRPK